MILRAILVLALLTGCTITETFKGGERVSRSWSVGAPPAPDLDGRAVTVKARTVGLLVSRERVLIGYAASTALYVDRDCIAAFFLTDAAEAARIMELLGPTEQICTATEVLK